MDSKVKLPIGIEDFVKIRTEGFYYVDKTGLIKELLESRGKVPEKLKLRILEEKDLDRLQQWLTFAAASGSVGEFQKKLDGE